MIKFNEWVSDFGLIDMPIPNTRFTWSNFRENAACSRLDRFFISNQWFDKFPASSGLTRPVSDHCHLLMDTDSMKIWPSALRFKNMWLQHKSFKDSVKNWWLESESQQLAVPIQQKLQSLKAHLKRWNKESCGDVTQKKEELLRLHKELDEKESSGIISEDNRKQRYGAKQSFKKLSLGMKLSGAKSLRVNWLPNGDNNTKFFHSFANSRRSNNQICSLLIDGSECTNLQSVEDHGIQHFLALYRRINSRVVGSWIGPKNLCLHKRCLGWKDHFPWKKSKKQCSQWHQIKLRGPMVSLWILPTLLG